MCRSNKARGKRKPFLMLYLNAMGIIVASCIAFVMTVALPVSAQESGEKVQDEIKEQGKPDQQEQIESAEKAEKEAPQATETKPAVKLSPEEMFKAPMSVDFKDMDVDDALHYLSVKSGLNMVSSNNVSGRTSMSLKNVPLQDIFDLILRNNKLAYVKKGDVFQIMSEAEYKSLYGKNFSDTRVVKIIRIQYAVPEQVFTMLEALKSEIGRVLVDQESGNVLLMDTPQQVEVMERSLQQIEQMGNMEVFNLQYAKAQDVEDILKSRLDLKKAGSIKADERNNLVIVQTYPMRMKEVREIIAKLDRPTKQVLIETKIIKIKLSDQLESGVEWEGIFDAGDDFGSTSYVGSSPYSVINAGETDATFTSREDWYAANNQQIGSYPFSGTSSSLSSSTKTTLGENLHFGFFDGKKDADFLLNLFKTIGETKVLANPKLVVVNNQEAEIHIGEKQAYVTTTTTSGQTTSTIAEEVQFIDVGIQLSVTPIINDDGFITMKVKPEISNVGSTLITPTNNRIPILDTTLTETTVMVKDGVTLLIGGLRKEERSLTSEHMPILGDLPLLKWVFRNQTNKVDRTEIVVMLTPHIISGTQFTTGSRGEFTGDGDKEYSDYEPLLKNDDAGQGAQADGVQMKSYHEYPSIKDEPAIDGMIPKGEKGGV